MTNHRRLSFKAAPGVTVPCPQVWPIDKQTGELIHGVRRCEVVSEHDGLTVMKLEVILLRERSSVPDQTAEQMQSTLENFTKTFNALGKKKKK